MDKKNIAIIIPSIINGGGAEKSALLVQKFLSDHFNVYVITFCKIPKEYQGKYFIGLGDSAPVATITNTVTRLYQCRKLLKKHNIELVLGFKETASFLSVLLGISIRSLKILVLPRGNTSFRTKGQRMLMKLLYPFADGAIVQSHRLATRLLLNCKPKHISVIPNIYEFPDNNVVNERVNLTQYGITDLDFVLISISRLVDDKNITLQLMAMQQLVNTDPTIKLLVVGDGPFEHELKQQCIDLNIVDHVVFVGRQDNVYSFLRYSHILLLTSLSEGMPNVVIEAMRFNVPVISTDCETGPRELLLNADHDDVMNYPEISPQGILIADAQTNTNTAVEQLVAAILSTKLQSSSLPFKPVTTLNRFKPAVVAEQWKDCIEGTLSRKTT